MAQKTKGSPHRSKRENRALGGARKSPSRNDDEAIRGLRRNGQSY